jgi:toxin ParE1/3/4
MSRYRLSVDAERDIEGIIRFTIERWGWDQAERYASDLHAAFELLARHPALGRRIDHLRAGYRRFEHGSHSVYYRASEDGVTIVRLLHRRMQPGGRV